MNRPHLIPIRKRLLELQGGVCAICGTDRVSRPERPRNRVWAVDHCHETGFIRGVLCRSCNSLLGRHRENLEVLKDRMPGVIDYLTRPHTGIPYEKK